MMAEVRRQVLPAMQKHGPVVAWIVDDTGFPKQGKHSVGVARQYCGQLGKQANCQAAVSLSVSTWNSSLPIAWRLYLPEAWCQDSERRQQAGVPEEIVFQTKPEIALEQIRQALEQQVPLGVVLADAAYGNGMQFRAALTTLRLQYMVGIESSTTVWERALQRLQEQFALIGVELNREKTKVVNTLKGEAFGFLGFDLRRVRKRKGDGYFILMTPKKKARKAIKAKVRDIIARGGATPAAALVKRINAALAGWVNYFRVGNASRAFSEVRDYTEMKVRTLLTRRKRRRKSSVGWRRWSNEYLYEVLGLYWDWKVQPLPGVEAVK
jgi:hypothetical protein